MGTRLCDALRDLVPFIQFKKCEKHPWRSVNFSKVAGLKPIQEKTEKQIIFGKFLCVNNYNFESKK